MAVNLKHRVPIRVNFWHVSELFEIEPEALLGHILAFLEVLVVLRSGSLKNLLRSRQGFDATLVSNNASFEDVWIIHAFLIDGVLCRWCYLFEESSVHLSLVLRHRAFWFALWSSCLMQRSFFGVVSCMCWHFHVVFLVLFPIFVTMLILFDWQPRVAVFFLVCACALLMSIVFQYISWLWQFLSFSYFLFVSLSSIFFAFWCVFGGPA